MVRMDIAYDGSFTYGFQKQESLMSVQGTVEGALKAVCGSYIPVVGASRTDRGVHALHNVVSFVLRDDVLYERVVRRLPVMMPEWLTIRNCVRESANFSARFSTVKPMPTCSSRKEAGPHFLLVMRIDSSIPSRPMR